MGQTPVPGALIKNHNFSFAADTFSCCETFNIPGFHVCTLSVQGGYWAGVIQVYDNGVILNLETRGTIVNAIVSNGQYQFSFPATDQVNITSGASSWTGVAQTFLICPIEAA